MNEDIKCADTSKIIDTLYDILKYVSKGGSECTEQDQMLWRLFDAQYHIRQLQLSQTPIQNNIFEQERLRSICQLIFDWSEKWNIRLNESQTFFLRESLISPLLNQ